MFKNLLSLFSLFFLISSPTSSHAAPLQERTPGEKAPGFTLPGIDGAEYSLSDYAGKVVVLEWFNKGCPFVKKHYVSGNMQKLQEKFTGQEVAWLTIISSAPGKQGHGDAATHQTTFEEWSSDPTAVLIDEDGSVGRLYGAKTTPHLFVINAGGEIAYQGAIDDTPSTRPEDIPTSTNYLDQALTQLMQGEPVATASTKPYGCSVKYDY